MDLAVVHSHLGGSCQLLIDQLAEVTEDGNNIPIITMENGRISFDTVAGKVYTIRRNDVSLT